MAKAKVPETPTAGQPIPLSRIKLTWMLFRDELSGFLHTMDRRGHENDRAFYCEAWNGTGAYTYDRIGRGTLHIRAACLSVCGFRSNVNAQIGRA